MFNSLIALYKEHHSFFINAMASLNVGSHTSLRIQWLQFIIEYEEPNNG